MKHSHNRFSAALLVGFAVLFIPGCSYREEIKHNLWAAGAVSKGSPSDIWIEYEPIHLTVVGVYRDYDGDGLIDERVQFSGSMVAVYRSSKHDGVMDVVRNSLDPAAVDERISPDSPEAGPFTRAKLDDVVRRSPVFKPAGG
jgi:hypothetical protein